QPFLVYWQARDYFRWERSLGEPRLFPLAEMEVKFDRPLHRPANAQSPVSRIEVRRREMVSHEEQLGWDQQIGERRKRKLDIL
ncbi:hypothetical protein, partial [Rhizobium leguminosarum]|uniref:hypothetical protein n=1 Tax=Rhizobium leguminosarum TaxID=384 RepID=UPI003F974197